MREYFRNQDEYLHAEVLKAQESERQFLARELHDEMSQHLTAMHLYASSIIQLSKIESVVRNAHAIDQISVELMRIVHYKINELRSKSSEDINSIHLSNIQKMVDEWRRQHPNIKLHCLMNLPEEECCGGILYTLYRLIQEALTNISRHANASNVLIRTTVENKRLVLTIEDDGQGFDMEKRSERHGLIGIKERVTEHRGLCTIKSSLGEGVMIRVFLPLISGKVP